jgi:hypothetical protein
MSENEGIVTPNPKMWKEGPLRGFFNICTKFYVRIISKTPNLAIPTIYLRNDWFVRKLQEVTECPRSPKMSIYDR